MARVRSPSRPGGRRRRRRAHRQRDTRRKRRTPPARGARSPSLLAAARWYITPTAMMVNRAVTWIYLVAVLAGCSGGGGRRATDRPPPRGEPARIAILVTVDGLMPEAYTAPDQRGLAVPTLRSLARNGAWASGARPVMPTVTYPAHTTLATGVEPGRHGIVSNRAFDPL